MILLLLLSLTATTYVSASVSVCTVTGSTVIAFEQTGDTVPDRCAYTLLTSTTDNFDVVGVFQDRRQVHVSLLDRVIVTHGGATIQLGPGRRVIQDGNDLEISGTLQQNDFTLTKGTTGVHASFSNGGGTYKIIFDGFTLHIEVTGPLAADSTGLCQVPTDASANKDSAKSLENCDVSQTATNEVSNDICNTMNTRCDALNNDPFASCTTNKASYIAACKDTMCKYPEKDGFSVCLFKEAYVNVCKMLGTTIPDTWRATASCSAPTTFCQDIKCGDHEFCGENISDEESCLCRSIFATPLRTDQSYGGVTKCEGKSSKLTLVRCLLEEKGIDYTDLQLNKASCKGQLDQDNNVTFSFDNTDTCEASVTDTVESQAVVITYKNIVQTPAATGDTTRYDPVSIGFSCTYTSQNPAATTFRIMDSSVTKTFSSESWAYSVTMAAYTNAKRTKSTDSNTEIQLKQTIWMKLEATGLDENLIHLVIDSCMATDGSDNSKTHNLITNGCSSDSTVTIETNGQGTSGLFFFKMFHFVNGAQTVTLDCNLKLCLQNCQPVVSMATRTDLQAVDLQYDSRLLLHPDQE
ncbi:hypothetical protein PAMP_004236 [Pampus punctatissimus]